MIILVIIDCNLLRRFLLQGDNVSSCARNGLGDVDSNVVIKVYDENPRY
jgi:hypothetical protein